MLSRHTIFVFIFFLSSLLNSKISAIDQTGPARNYQRAYNFALAAPYECPQERA